jgi:hypothetical protein
LNGLILTFLPIRDWHTYGLGSGSFYDFTVKDATGKDFPLSKLNDKKAILVVNVASQCK